MKSHCLAITIFLLVFCLAAPVLTYAMEDMDKKPMASASVGAYSKFIMRGFEMSDKSLVVQPEVMVGYMGFSLGIMGVLDTAWRDPMNMMSDHREVKWIDTETTLSYDREIGPVKVGAGYTYYSYPTMMDDSADLFLRVGLKTILSPSVTVYREILHRPSWYVRFCVSHSIPLPEKITLDMGASAAYYWSDDAEFSMADDMSEKYRAWHDGLVWLGLTIPLGRYFSLVPTVAYSFPLTENAQDMIRMMSMSDESSFFYGGVKVVFAF